MADAMQVDGPQAGPSHSQPIHVQLSSGEELVLELEEFDDSDTSMLELKELFVAESCGPDVWTRVAADYWRRYAPETALKMAQWGLEEMQRRRQPHLEVPMLCLMATYNLSLSRNAPTLILKDARADKLTTTVTKGQYYQKATQLINRADSLDQTSMLVLDARAALQLATGKLDDAMKTFDRILAKFPSHTAAQMGRARILCARRQHRAALKVYQNVLATAPSSLPDPRIGIGICFYNLGERELAQKAWERSLTANPSKASVGATLLLGLMHLNAGRDPNLSEDVKAQQYVEGINRLQEVWKADKTIASAASGLAGHFLTMRQWPTAIKLGERAIQYADSRAALSEGQLVMARALHAQDKLNEAAPFYSRACEKTPEQLVAAIAAAQIYTTTGGSDYPTAVNAFENILRNQPSNIESLVNLAAIHAHQGFTSPSASDQENERRRAMELYEQVMRIVAPRMLDSKAPMANGQGEVPPNASVRVREVGSNPDLYVEIARLWSDRDPTRALKALRESIRLRGEGGAQAALHGNVGCLEYALGNFAEARNCFEDALSAAAKQTFASEMAQQATLMTLFYNLGVAYEATDETDRAIEMYEKRILVRHPEYIEVKCRLALIYLRRREHERAHDLLKQALTAQPQHLETRCLYIYFLIETHDLKAANAFVSSTLSDINKKDVYAMCAGGMLQYQRARENKNPGQEAAKDRAGRYIRAAEFFDKCLQLDPQCAIAAQGVAIALAEGVLGMGKEVVSGTAAASESERRLRNTRDALTILTKIREAVRDGSVYVNIGHCHFAREEWDRAIENYETASKRFYHGRNISVLLHVARSWFFKAIKDERYAFMSNALAYARQARDLAPKDDAIRFNIAIIQHRGLEILNSLDDEKNESKLAKRSVEELEQAIQEVEEAQVIFASLADNKAKNLTYNAELAAQRVAFGRSLLSRARESIPRQADFERREEAKTSAARTAREQARQRQADQETARLAAIALHAEQLAAQRRAAQEEAAKWYTGPTFGDSDAEDGRKKRGRKKKIKRDDKDDRESSLSAVDSEMEDKIKRKRTPRKKAPKEEEETNGVEAFGLPAELPADGGEEDGEDEDDALLRPAKKSRKAYKSAEIIEDSDADE